MGNLHFINVACIFAFFGFQCHILTMARSTYYLGLPKTHAHENRDNVIQAFIIIAYALFIIGLIMALMLRRSKHTVNACAAVATAIVLILAGTLKEHYSIDR